MRWIILVEILQLAQWQADKYFTVHLKYLGTAGLPVCTHHTMPHMTSLVFTACATTCGMAWHDSHCMQMNWAP